jgi:hypothetical protein
MPSKDPHQPTSSTRRASGRGSRPSGSAPPHAPLLETVKSDPDLSHIPVVVLTTSTEGIPPQV